MSGKKCKHCGSSEIEVDPARGDAVCTNCGTVLEDNIIVAEVEFQENAHGGASAIGQFVSADSKGGASGFGGGFNAGVGQESREITLRKARNGISILCQQLHLNQHCIDIACNFFKMALLRHLTIGRPASHTHAACIYMTCRTERTAHLLIDISDALQICCYQLGRTYFRLSKALCINIPPTDPCIYILRFASQLQFGDKQHEVSMTAQRLVQRMKRDFIHYGRRPSGICGAALLIAARLHNFSRTPADIVRIVKVHECTIRKRLIEFGETPSSALTLEEFNTVDLEEDQDPPAFRAARKRDKERLQKLMDEDDGERELTQLQKEIDAQLEKDSIRRQKAATAAATPSSVLSDTNLSGEDADASRFAAEDTLNLIGEITRKFQPKDESNKNAKNDHKIEKLKLEKGLGPDLAVIGLGSNDDKSDRIVKPELKQSYKDLVCPEELELNEKDEEYVSSLIMSEEEARHKTIMWNKINSGYLKEQKIKEELRAREREENKDKKKKVRGSYKKKVACSAATAGEAIEKMLAEKKFSSKINYDILKSLDQPGSTPAAPASENLVTENKPPTPVPKETVPQSPVARKRKKKNPPATLSSAPSPATPGPYSLLSPTPNPRTPQPATPTATPAAVPSAPPTSDIEPEDDEEDVEPEHTAGVELDSLGSLLRNGDDEDYYGYDEY